MQLNMLKSKIHRAVVVQAELSYVGSITVDKDLLDAAMSATTATRCAVTAAPTSRWPWPRPRA